MYSVSSELYCCVEVDSYGIISLRARTRKSENSKTPTWNQEFGLEVEGTQTLRILCYDYTKGLEDEMIDKGAKTVSLALDQGKPNIYDMLQGCCRLFGLCKHWILGWEDISINSNIKLSGPLDLRYFCPNLRPSISKYKKIPKHLSQTWWTIELHLSRCYCTLFQQKQQPQPPPPQHSLTYLFSTFLELFIIK